MFISIPRCGRRPGARAGSRSPAPRAAGASASFGWITFWETSWKRARFDGVLACTPEPADTALLCQLAPHGVGLSSPQRDWCGATADPDDRAIGEAAAAHFLECGFRNVALIADQFPFGSGGLVINNTGAGGVSMFGANAFTGGVTLNAGTLTIGAAGALGTAAHVLTVNGGNLRTVIGATVANGLTTVSDPLAPSDAGQYTAIVPFAAGNNLAANVNAATRVTYDPVTGIGYISPVDATKVYQATLRVSSDANLGSLAAPVNFQGTGGTLQFAASSTFAKPIVFAGGGGGNLDTGANIVTLASPLSGVTVAGFNKLGSGSLTLAASSPLFAGRVAVNAGSDGFEAAPLSPFECASAGLGNDLESFTPRSSQATCSAWRL